MSEIIKTISLGTVTLGPKIQITDPGYTPDLWCSKEKKILPGEYLCSVRRAPVKEWGMRTLSIKIQHKDHPDAKIDYSDEITAVPVDSGQAGFFDHEYFIENNPQPGGDILDLNDKWYGRICEITTRNENDFDTIDGKGVVSSSGFGDGCYGCYAARHKKDTVALEIVFIEENYLKETN